MPLWKVHLHRKFQRLRRYRHIMAVLMKYGFEEAAGVLRGRLAVRLGQRAVPHITKAVQGRSRPERVRMAMEELGPTFVKLGQLLSTRPDLIPDDYIQEFGHLQDQVAPENFSRIRAEVEKELGEKLECLFESFEPVPVAAGSIAQVHRATTKDGKSAAVKVRRPGMVDTVRAECEILQDLASLLKATILESETIDAQEIVKELSQAILKEADLANERRNQLRFRQNFANEPNIHVPQVYQQYCSAGVLTMEYIQGIKPGSSQMILQAGLDPKVVARRGADFVFRQIFEFGFFHADPHPGNFFILPDNVLAPIDFGQVASLSSQDRRLLNEMLLAIVDNDAQGMIHAFERAGIIDEGTNVDNIARDLEQMLQTYQNVSLKDIPFGSTMMQAFDLFRKHHVRPPAQFTLMLKSLMTIECFATSLDGEFEIFEYLKPYARQFSLRDISPKQMLRNMRRAMYGAGDLATRLPDDVNVILNKFRRGQFQVRIHHEHLENLTKTLDKSSNRLSFSLIIAALLVGSSLLVSQQGTVLGLFSLQTLGLAGYFVATIIGIGLVLSIMRSGKL